QTAERLSGPRTALVAEAAHVMPPIGAQGLNMSLADIETLLDLVTGARSAGKDIGAPELLARYARARRPDIAMRVTGVDLLNRAAMTEAQPLRDLRRIGLRALSGIGPLKQTVMRLGLGAR
ncbi:MAG: FAD-dependent monooxygenase, partial [Pseudomonadota bacterium]